MGFNHERESSAAHGCEWGRGSCYGWEREREREREREEGFGSGMKRREAFGLK